MNLAKDFFGAIFKKVLVDSRKRQMSDSSWEFLKIENEQLKTVQNNSYE